VPSETSALRWIPRASAALAFAACVIVPASRAAPDHPLALLLDRIAMEIPIGAAPDRVRFAAAICAAVLAWLVSNTVRASIPGMIAAGLLAAAGPLAGAPASASMITAIAVVLTCELGDRVARGGGAPYGIMAAFTAGIALASGVAAIGAPIALVVLLIKRLRHGARWALAAPSAIALGAAVILGAIAIRGGIHSIHWLGAHDPAGAAARARSLVEAYADALGPIALAAAAAGVIVVIVEPSRRWLGVAIALAATSTIADALTTSRAPIDPTVIALAAITAGAAIARLSRVIKIKTGEIAAGCAAALIVAAPAALATYDRYFSRGSHSSSLLPSGSTIHANLPLSSDTTSPTTVAPASRTCASIASRSSTTKLNM